MRPCWHCCVWDPLVSRQTLSRVVPCRDKPLSPQISTRKISQQGRWVKQSTESEILGKQTNNTTKYKPNPNFTRREKIFSTHSKSLTTRCTILVEWGASWFERWVESVPILFLEHWHYWKGGGRGFLCAPLSCLNVTSCLQIKEPWIISCGQNCDSSWPSQSLYGSDQRHKRQRSLKEGRTVREGGKWKGSPALRPGNTKKPSAADVSEEE